MIVLRIARARPADSRPRWLVPGIVAGLLVALLLADPAHIEGRARWLRHVASVLILSLAAVALVATAVLIADLIEGAKVTDEASTLLASGALIWLGNCLVFSLLYWHFDSGGPLARYRGDRRTRDFAFTQHMSPEFAPPGWRPQYVDYLILGLTTSTAFSPTDVMPMTLGEADDGAPVGDLAGGHRARDRAGSERLLLREDAQERRQHRVELLSRSCSPSPLSARPGARTSRRSGAATRPSTRARRRRLASSRPRPRRVQVS